MASIRIPTPLRPYAGDQQEVEVSGGTVGEALTDLVTQYPDLKKHLYNDGKLRSFVNVFLGEEDIRFLDGEETPIDEDTELLIIPSIAGGMESARTVDQSALRTNQAFIIGLLLLGFLLDAWPLVAFVAAVMLIGTIWPGAALFKLTYKHALRPAGIVKPDVTPDNPEPHRFAQGVGAAFNLAATAVFLAGVPVVGWILAWVVIVLASANLFLGWCAGCFFYYQLNRLGVPGFAVAPIQE